MNLELSDANIMNEEEEPEISDPIVLDMIPSFLPPQATNPFSMIAILDLNGNPVEEEKNEEPMISQPVLPPAPILTGW